METQLKFMSTSSNQWSDSDLNSLSPAKAAENISKHPHHQIPNAIDFLNERLKLSHRVLEQGQILNRQRIEFNSQLLERICDKLQIDISDIK